MAHVLIVDDEADTLEHVADAVSRFATVDLRHPRDVLAEHVEAATVILVDYQLDHWADRYGAATVSMQPDDGLALAAVYRAIARRREGPPPAVALYSAQLEQLAPIPSETRPHVLARLAGLEWVFPKIELNSIGPDGELGVLARRVADLGEAVERMPMAWPGDPVAARALIEELLGLPAETEFAETCWQQFLRCHPPIHELSAASHGMWFLRWMLHYTIPYPTCLIGDMGLAQRLKLLPVGVETLVTDDNDVSGALGAVRYRGIFGEFSGRRWWKKPVDDLVRSWTTGDGDVRAAVADLAGTSYPSFGGDDPVVCLDGNLSELPDLYERHAARQIRPDDWPLTADRVFAPCSLVDDDPAIAALSARADAIVVVRTDVQS